MLLYNKDGEREKKEIWVSEMYTLVSLICHKLTSAFMPTLDSKTGRESKVLMSEDFNSLNICISITFRSVKEEKHNKKKTARATWTTTKRHSYDFHFQGSSSRASSQKDSLSPLVKAVESTGKSKLWSQKGVTVITYD